MSVGTPGALPQPPSAAAYLGQGLAYPLAYDPNTGRLKLSSGLKSVQDALSAILQTQPGERAMQPDFGCDVGTFEPPDTSRLKAQLDRTLADHEPRIKSVDVQTPQPGPTNQEQIVTIGYEVVGQANTQTLVFPYFTGP